MTPYDQSSSYSRQSRQYDESPAGWRASVFSDTSDAGSYDPYRPPSTQQPLSGRPSLVSLPSSGTSHASASPSVAPRAESFVSGWGRLYKGAGTRYEPVSGGGGAEGRQASRSFTPVQTTAREPIREEPHHFEDGIDMATLVNHAAPIGRESVDDDNDDDDDGAVPFDVTGFMGPETSQDHAFAQTLQENEDIRKDFGAPSVTPRGVLRSTTIRESQLLAASPRPSRGMFRQRSGMQRHQTVRALGQSQADRTGQVVEVIMEDQLPAMMQSDVDVSHILGPDTHMSGSGGIHGTTLRTKTQRSETFYPQPDWKPFSMRWPWLLFLIILSITLGGVQEIIYQISTRQPNNALVTFKSPTEVPPFIYFCFKFLPTIVTVSFGVLWQTTDFEVKRLEAFYQLSKPEGALAAESINVDYVTFFSFFRPFRALYCRHYAVAVSTVSSLLAVSLVPTLGAASIVLQPGREERAKDIHGDKFITIHPVYSRVLTAAFYVIALLGCILFWQLQKRRSGLFGDVKGIAGLAAMAVVSHMLMDFKDMDIATHNDIHHRLREHRYVLRNAALVPDEDNPASSAEKERYKDNHLSQNPHPVMMRARGCIPFIVGILLFAGLIPSTLFTPLEVITERAAWLITALAILIKLSWGGLETSVRMMEPFYILSRRHAPGKVLTLDYTAMPFGWVSIQALFNRHMLVFFVTFGTVMTEFLTILVTSLATAEGHNFLSLAEQQQQPASSKTDEISSGQETELSFWISLGLVVFILGYMGVVASIVFLRRRRPFLPRQPNTIASVLAFIHRSTMLTDFAGTNKYTSAEMLELIESLRADDSQHSAKTYGLGWFQGRDGQTHCGVDQEELMSSYRLGYDYSMSNKPWLEEHTPWL